MSRDVEQDLVQRHPLGHDRHMRLARLLLVCVMGLGVSFQGVASAMAIPADCPMARQVPAGTEASTATFAGESGAVAIEDHNCCPDEDGPAEQGKTTCAIGMNCQAAAVVLPLTAASPSGISIAIFRASTSLPASLSRMR